MIYNLTYNALSDIISLHYRCYKPLPVYPQRPIILVSSRQALSLIYKNKMRLTHVGDIISVKLCKIAIGEGVGEGRERMMADSVVSFPHLSAQDKKGFYFTKIVVRGK